MGSRLNSIDFWAIRPNFAVKCFVDSANLGCRGSVPRIKIVAELQRRRVIVEIPIQMAFVVPGSYKANLVVDVDTPGERFAHCGEMASLAANETAGVIFSDLVFGKAGR